MRENERKWKKMKENDREWKNMKEHVRKWRKMKEHDRKWKNMKENERETWRKMKENERKWKKMKENKRKWKKMKENEIKWKKMKENGKKWKKWKKQKKEEKMKKINKKEENDEKKKEKWKKLDSHPKSSTISRVYSCCCNFFRQNHRRFPWLCFGMCLFPEENQTTRFGWCSFFRGKVTIFIGRETKTHILPKKINEKKIAKVSPSNNNYSFRIKKPFNNTQHTTTTQQQHNNNNNTTTTHNNNTQQQHTTSSTTTTIIQSGKASFWQARSLHSTLGSWSMLSPKQAAQPNPSYPALVVRTPHLPWSTDYGGNN